MALIEVRNITKVYRNDGAETHALRGVSFEIAKGEFVAIMGPSGSGKSTLLHIIGFLDRPTNGTYRFNGKSLKEHTDGEIARVRNEQMGFVFQTFNLLPRAASHLLRAVTVRDRDDEKALQNQLPHARVYSIVILEQMSTQAVIVHYPAPLRVAIARALVNKPEVIFADEPTGNLDSKSGEVIMDILQELNEKHEHTVILITHESYTAEHAERILHLYDGKIDSDKRVRHRKHAKDGFRK